MTMHFRDTTLPPILDNGRNDCIGRWPCLAAGLLFATVFCLSAGTSFGQTPGNGEPGFRDPTTGRVYTPGNVGKDGTPVPLEDRAFDPSSQHTGSSLRTSFQSPTWRAVGPAPVTASHGSSIPPVTFETASLRPQTPGRWVLELVVVNNSATAISPSIECAFSNGSQIVEFATARLYNIPPGQRVQASIYGPESGQMFVDNAPCSAVTQ